MNENLDFIPLKSSKPYDRLMQHYISMFYLLKSIFFHNFSPNLQWKTVFLRILCPDIKISKWLCSKPKHTEYASQAIFWTKYHINIVFKHFFPLFFAKYMVRPPKNRWYDFALIFPRSEGVKLKKLWQVSGPDCGAKTL